MAAEFNNFQGLPFTAASTPMVSTDEETYEDTLWFFDKCTEEVANKLVGSPINLKMATTFGQIYVRVVIESGFENKTPDIMKDPVANIVQKSLLRCMAVSTITSAGETEDKASLQGMILSLMSCLQMESKEEEFRRLCHSPSKNQIDQLVDDILGAITDKIIQEAQQSKIFKSFMLPNFLSDPLAWLGQLLFSMKAEWLELDYMRSLLYISKIVKRVSTKDIFHLEMELMELEDSEEKEMEEAKIEYDKNRSKFSKFWHPGLEKSAKNEIRRKRDNKKVCLVERMLIQLIGGIEGALDFSDKLGSVLNLLDLEANKLKSVYSSILIFKSVHVIRLAYSTQCFVGFVGPQNAGKSTLLNKLFGMKAETGERTHTDKPTKYKVAENVFAVDFPGRDSLEDHRNNFADFGQMNNLFIYVVPYNGSPSESLVENVRTAYAVEKQAGYAARTLFCISMCGSERFKGYTFGDDYKKEFVGKIKDEISRSEFETGKDGSLQKLAMKLRDTAANTSAGDFMEEIKKKEREQKEYILENLKEDDFMFTDQLSPDPSRGIKGPKEVKERIKKYLLQMQIYSEEELTDLF